MFRLANWLRRLGEVIEDSFSVASVPCSEGGRKTVIVLDRDHCAVQRAGRHSLGWPSDARGGLAPHFLI